MYVKVHHMSKAKTAQRISLKAKRASLDDSYCKESSLKISQKLKDLATSSGAQKIHTYSPITKNNEVDISPFNDWVQAQEGLELYVQDLTGNFPDKQFDMIICPGIAFDKHGNRLGYGGGNYDRFLATQTSAIKIGVCFERMIQEEIVTEAHDEAMSLTILENSQITTRE